MASHLIKSRRRLDSGFEGMVMPTPAWPSGCPFSFPGGPGEYARLSSTFAPSKLFLRVTSDMVVSNLGRSLTTCLTSLYNESVACILIDLFSLLCSGTCGLSFNTFLEATARKPPALLRGSVCMRESRREKSGGKKASGALWKSIAGFGGGASAAPVIANVLAVSPDRDLGARRCRECFSKTS
jgi:hypothetical protein